MKVIIPIDGLSKIDLTVLSNERIEGSANAINDVDPFI